MCFMSNRDQRAQKALTLSINNGGFQVSYRNHTLLCGDFWCDLYCVLLCLDATPKERKSRAFVAEAKQPNKQAILQTSSTSGIPRTFSTNAIRRATRKGVCGGDSKCDGWKHILPSSAKGKQYRSAKQFIPYGWSFP